MLEKIDNGMVSIIVPIYRVENYLKECIDSLRNQTYENIEIILVDDESPDRCPEICEEYSKKDYRIKVIHKKNGGAASARNLGIDIAKGKFICFVDSDDFVESNYVEMLMNQLILADADIAVCSFDEKYVDTIVERRYEEKYREMTQIGYLSRFLRDWTCGMMTNKIFKKKIIGDIRFPEGHKIDDEFFTYKIVLKSEKVVVFSDVLYHYRMRKSSVMQSGIQYKECMLSDRIEYLTERYELVVKIYPELRRIYLQNLVDNFIAFWKNSVDMPLIRKKLKKIFKCYVKEILLGSITLKEKCIFIYCLGRYMNKKDESEVVNEGEKNKLYE